MRWVVVCVFAVVMAACGDDGGDTPPAVAPEVATFSVNPQVVVAGQPTTVAWYWTYANEPSPAPDCTIEGIGAIVSGGQSGVLLTQDTTYTLTCTNSAGTSTAQTSIMVSGVSTPPDLGALVATPSQVVSGTPTAITWSWTYANTPSPAPDCTLDQGVGTIASGGTTTVTQTASTTYTLTCTNSAGSDTAQVTVDVVQAGVAPVLSTFTANPSSVTTGVPTSVTWAWTYSNSPTPAPTCSVNQGVGTVTSGQATSVTQTSSTTYTLTCTNSAGTSTRTVTVTTTAAPVAPNLATFTTNPTSVTMGVPTAVSWSWTYANSPTPAPTCSIDNGVGTLTSGASRTISLATATTYTLTCTNSAGQSTATVTVGVTPPVAPVLDSFTLTPSSVTSGVATNVQFFWTYSTQPVPAATCTVDQSIGTITSGSTRSVTLTQATTYTLTCTNGGGTSTRTATIAVTAPVAPVIATFTTNPTHVASGATTPVAWSWTYANTPAPAPTCSIDNGVGTLTSGTLRNVSQTVATTYTLTCTNTGGTSTATVTLQIAIPPVLASFTATPSPLAYQTPTLVTWTYAFANTPVPTPTCSIENVGTVTSGATLTLTLPQARTYRLSCANQGGQVTAETTLAVTECGTAAERCDANAACTDTVAGFTCACDAGFTGDGYTCSGLAACDVTPSLCSPDATCTNTTDGYACICNDGYVGDGASCQRNRIAFVTSTTGNGNLGAWPEATGTGLAAADAICNARATAAGLPGTYVAWLSDSTSDAYCRVHGLTGKKSANCGQASLPASAGPWVRPDGLPTLGRIDRVIHPTYEMYYPASLDENGASVLPSAVWTSTSRDGVLQTSGAVNACVNWTDSAASTNRSYVGSVHQQGEFWTISTSVAAYCDAAHRLRCLEVGSGPALPPIAPTGKTVFLTSVTGGGNMSSWADAFGATGLNAADNVCRARARFVGHPNASAFKAWMSTSTSSATSRITTSGPWYRRDGVLVASSKPDLLDNTLHAPINVTELRTIGPDTSFQGVWTATAANGTGLSSTCSSWSTSASGTYGGSGKVDVSESASWTSGSSTSCNALQPIYCFED